MVYNKLNKRLKCCADFIKKGEIVLDVGTDHGYLPLYLLEAGICSKIYASDINEGPLNKAISNIEKYGYAENTVFYLRDGIGNCPSDVTTVVIAGMGGETAAGIIKNASFVSYPQIIIQPQSKIKELKEALYSISYNIDDAVLCKDGDRLYIVYKCSHAEEITTDYTEIVDELLFSNNDPLLVKYIKKIKKLCEKRLNGLLNSESSLSGEIEEAKKELNKILSAEHRAEVLYGKDF